MRLIDWILGLFDKPKEEINPAEVAPWSFPAPVKSKRKYVRKATTRKPAVKKPVAKKAVKKPVKKAK